MSKSLGDLLREMDAKATNGPWLTKDVPLPGISNTAIARNIESEGGRCVYRHAGDDVHFAPEKCATWLPATADAALIVALRNALPLIAAVLDAADAMRDWTPVSYVPGLLPEPIEALRVEACATYDAARAALAEALKEGR